MCVYVLKALVCQMYKPICLYKLKLYYKFGCPILQFKKQTWNLKKEPLLQKISKILLYVSLEAKPGPCLKAPLFFLDCSSLVSVPFTFPDQQLFEPFLGFLGGSDGNASAYNVGGQGSIPGSGRSPGEENGNPLRHSCLENPMDGGT